MALSGFAIINDIPYDRPKTSMRHFTMCSVCQSKYDDPTNRRFHAQPNACADCGPCVSLYDNHRSETTTRDPIGSAAGLLKQGFIVAVKGLDGYHLAADAENTDAVKRLRGISTLEMSPISPLKALPLLARARARGLNSRIPPLWG